MHIMSGVMKPLQTLFGRHQQPVGVEPDADVAVVRRGVAARVQAAADFDDVGAELGFGRASPALVARPARQPLRAEVGDPRAAAAR